MILQFLLGQPEVMHALFALGGLALGWLIKHSQGDTRLPPDLADVIAQLLARRQQRLAQSILTEAATDHPVVLPHPAMPAAPPPPQIAAPAPAPPAAH